MYEPDKKTRVPIPDRTFVGRLEHKPFPPHIVPRRGGGGQLKHTNEGLGFGLATRAGPHPGTDLNRPLRHDAASCRRCGDSALPHSAFRMRPPLLRPAVPAALSITTRVTQASAKCASSSGLTTPTRRPPLRLWGS